MTDQQHPIEPPIKLVDQWVDKYQGHMPEWVLRHVAAEAAQWGADVELEACCEWLDLNLPGYAACDRRLHAARRPEPQSLKEQALDELHTSFDRGYLKEGAADIIRRALETLPNG